MSKISTVVTVKVLSQEVTTHLHVLLYGAVGGGVLNTNVKHKPVSYTTYHYVITQFSCCDTIFSGLLYAWTLYSEAWGK